MAINFNGVAIIFIVTDIARTQRFYSEHLGIEFEQFEDEDGSFFLTTNISPEVELMVFKGEPKPGNTPNVVLGLSDGGIDTIVERLATAGVEIVTPVSPAPGGWFADFRDVDGHTLSFYQAAEKPRTLK